MQQKEDFSKYSDEELLNLLREEEALVVRYNLFQLAMKILINSLYGALAEKSFRFYDVRLAEAITSTGQVMIKYSGKILNEHVSKIIGKCVDVIAGGDTDSGRYDTIIKTDKGDIQIGELFNQSNEIIEVRPNGAILKKVDDLKALSYDKENFSLVFGNIKYIYKRRVKKELFEIEVDGNKVVVTKDHSLVVERKGEIISIKPREVLPTDLLLYVKEEN